MVQCRAITKSGEQCSREALEGSEYCWQHESKELALPNDILQHVFNPYLDYREEVPLVEQAFEGLKLIEKPHIRVEETF